MGAGFFSLPAAQVFSLAGQHRLQMKTSCVCSGPFLCGEGKKKKKKPLERQFFHFGVILLSPKKAQWLVSVPGLASFSLDTHLPSGLIPLKGSFFLPSQGVQLPRGPQNHVSEMSELGSAVHVLKHRNLGEHPNGFLYAKLFYKISPHKNGHWLLPHFKKLCLPLTTPSDHHASHPHALPSLFPYFTWI